MELGPKVVKDLCPGRASKKLDGSDCAQLGESSVPTNVLCFRKGFGWFICPIMGKSLAIWLVGHCQSCDPGTLGALDYPKSWDHPNPHSERIA